MSINEDSYDLSVGVNFTFHGPTGNVTVEDTLGAGYSIGADAQTDLREIVGRWSAYSTFGDKEPITQAEIDEASERAEAIVAKLMLPMFVKLAERAGA